MLDLILQPISFASHSIALFGSGDCDSSVVQEKLESRLLLDDGGNAN